MGIKRWLWPIVIVATMAQLVIMIAGAEMGRLFGHLCAVALAVVIGYILYTVRQDSKWKILEAIGVGIGAMAVFYITPILETFGNIGFAVGLFLQGIACLSVALSFAIIGILVWLKKSSAEKMVK